MIFSFNKNIKTEEEYGRENSRFVRLHNLHLLILSYTLADAKGCRGCMAPLQPNFFIFISPEGKNGKTYRLPQSGFPGSATASEKVMSVDYIISGSMWCELILECFL